MAGIARDFQFVVAVLKPVAFGIKPMAHQRIEDHPSGFAVRFFENQNRDHSIGWIAETKIRRPVSDGPRFIDPGLVGQNDRRDVAIGG